MMLENQGWVGEYLATHSRFLLPVHPSGEFSFHHPSLFLAHCGELTGVRTHSGWAWVCFSHPTLLRGRIKTLECGGDKRARKTKKPNFSLDVQPHSQSNFPRQSCASGNKPDSISPSHLPPCLSDYTHGRDPTVFLLTTTPNFAVPWKMETN